MIGFVMDEMRIGMTHSLRTCSVTEITSEIMSCISCRWGTGVSARGLTRLGWERGPDAAWGAQHLPVAARCAPANRRVRGRVNNGGVGECLLVQHLQVMLRHRNLPRRTCTCAEPVQASLRGFVRPHAMSRC